jgi:hypothetical protein
MVKCLPVEAVKIRAKPWERWGSEVLKLLAYGLSANPQPRLSRVWMVSMHLHPQHYSIQKNPKLEEPEESKGSKENLRVRGYENMRGAKKKDCMWVCHLEYLSMRRYQFVNVRICEFVGFFVVRSCQREGVRRVGGTSQLIPVWTAVLQEHW